MDRTHFLAAQAVPRDRHAPATRAEIDAFYDAHGSEVFARAFRLRRSIRALAARWARPSERKRAFAAVPSRR